MRQQKVWRYYCDHCPKSGCNSGHIRKHERHCLRNPARICRICERMGEEQISLEALVQAIYTGDIAGLRNAANGCPNCMCAGAMEWRQRELDAGTDPKDVWLEFDYSKELEAFWDATNQMAAQREYEYSGGQF